MSIMTEEDKHKPYYISTVDNCQQVLKEQREKADEYYFLSDLEFFTYVQAIRVKDNHRIQALVKLENDQAKTMSMPLTPDEFAIIRDFNLVMSTVPLYEWFN